MCNSVEKGHLSLQFLYLNNAYFGPINLPNVVACEIGYAYSLSEDMFIGWLFSFDFFKQVTCFLIQISTSCQKCKSLCSRRKTAIRALALGNLRARACAMPFIVRMRITAGGQFLKMAPWTFRTW